MDLCFAFFLPEGAEEPYNRFICTIDKSFPGLKRAKAGEKKAFGSVIDEVFSFDFKGSARRSAGGLALSSSLSWVEAKHVTCLSSDLNSSPAVSNKGSKQFDFLQDRPNVSMAIFFVFSPRHSLHFAHFFPVLRSIHFY